MDLRLMRVIPAALLALLLAAAPAAADQILPPGQIDGNGYLKFRGGPTLGRWQGNKYTATPDALQIQGPGSVGPVDGMSVGSAQLSSILSGFSGLGTAAFYGLLPSNTAAQNTSALATAIATLGATGGGTINFPCGTFAFTSIDNNVQGVLLKGAPSMSGARDAGTFKYCTRFLATQAGTLMRHRTPYGAGLSKFIGGGFENIMLDAGGVATKLLDVDTVGGGTYIGSLSNAQGREAAWFHNGLSGSDVADAADVQGAHIKLMCRQLDGTAAQAGDCFRLDGSANANFSYNEDVYLSCQTYNGNCLTGVNADNNRIQLRNFRAPGGAGYTVYAYTEALPSVGFTNNYFLHFGGNAPSYLQGTDAVGATAGVTNEIAFFDTTNSTPLPTSGPGSAWQGEFRQSYTPSIRCQSGSFAANGVTISSSYFKNPGRVSTFYAIAISNVGTCSGAIFVGVPIKAAADGVSVGAFIEAALTGQMLSAAVAAGAAEAAIRGASGSATWANGWVLTGQITYPSAY